MTISYPVNLPAGAYFERVVWTGVEAVGMSQSPFTMQQQVQRHDGQILGFSADMPPMTRTLAEQMIAWKLSLKGKYGTFLFGDPLGTRPQGTATGSPRVFNVASGDNITGAELLKTVGWTASVSTILKAGDWLQIGSGSSARMFKNLQDTASNGSGQATFDIWPKLRSDMASQAVIYVNSCVGLFRLRENNMSWSLENINQYGLFIEAMEAF